MRRTTETNIILKIMFEMNHTKANQKQILNSNGETGKNSKLFFIFIKSDIPKKYFRSQKKFLEKF